MVGYGGTIAFQAQIMFICDTVGFFLPTLLPTTPLDGGVQLDKSLQNALAPLLNARDVRRAPSAAAAACGTSTRVASFLKQAQALFGAQKPPLNSVVWPFLIDQGTNPMDSDSQISQSWSWKDTYTVYIGR